MLWSLNYGLRLRKQRSVGAHEYASPRFRVRRGSAQAGAQSMVGALVIGCAAFLPEIVKSSNATSRCLSQDCAFKTQGWHVEYLQKMRNAAS